MLLKFLAALTWEAFVRGFVGKGIFFHRYRTRLPLGCTRQMPDSRLKCNPCGECLICRLGKLAKVCRARRELRLGGRGWSAAKPRRVKRRADVKARAVSQICGPAITKNRGGSEVDRIVHYQGFSKGSAPATRRAGVRILTNSA